MKDKYMMLIKEAGFEDIVITDESLFPIDLVLNDSVAQEIIKKENISKEELEKVGDSIVSIKLICKK